MITSKLAKQPLSHHKPQSNGPKATGGMPEHLNSKHIDQKILIQSKLYLKILKRTKINMTLLTTAHTCMHSTLVINPFIFVINSSLQHIGGKNNLSTT